MTTSSTGSKAMGSTANPVAARGIAPTISSDPEDTPHIAAAPSYSVCSGVGATTVSTNPVSTS
jgi:hypothetical protein